MKRAAISITLQHKDGRPTLRLRIVFDNDGVVDAGDHIVQHNPVIVEFKNAMLRDLDIAKANKLLNAAKRLTHGAYSAASLTPVCPPPPFRFFAAGTYFFPSTGLRNCPV